MKHIKSPIATPTYRKRRGKREFWNATKAFANRDLLNPTEGNFRSSNKATRKFTKPIAEKPVKIESNITLESLGLSFSPTTQVKQSIV